MKKISSALISVFNKDKIEHLCQILTDNNVKIYSTGGTYEYINSLGIKLGLASLLEIHAKKCTR